jgi:hypothetical protein
MGRKMACRLAFVLGGVLLMGAGSGSASAAVRCTPYMSVPGGPWVVEIQRGDVDCDTATAVMQRWQLDGTQPADWRCYRTDIRIQGSERAACVAPVDAEGLPAGGADDYQVQTLLRTLDPSVPIICGSLKKAGFDVILTWATRTSCSRARSVARAYFPGCARARSSVCRDNGFRCKRINEGGGDFTARCKTGNKAIEIDYRPLHRLRTAVVGCTSTTYRGSRRRTFHVRTPFGWRAMSIAARAVARAAVPMGVSTASGSQTDSTAMGIRAQPLLTAESAGRTSPESPFDAR